MGFFKRLFTWWDGSALVSEWFIKRGGRHVGTDRLGNAYYSAKKGGRRYVMYEGSNDASRIPPEWHGWLHHQIADVPDDALPPPPKFLIEATPNLTGTPAAYRPAGALERGGRRQAASGDYQAWTPKGG